MFAANFQLPVENDTFEAIGSWCCISGTVTATIKLEKKGFAVKEAIPVWAEIKNLSTRRICSTHVSLIQVSKIEVEVWFNGPVDYGKRGILVMTHTACSVVCFKLPVAET